MEGDSRSQERVDRNLGVANLAKDVDSRSQEREDRNEGGEKNGKE